MIQTLAPKGKFQPKMNLTFALATPCVEIHERSLGGSIICSVIRIGRASLMRYRTTCAHGSRPRQNLHLAI